MVRVRDPGLLLVRIRVTLRIRVNVRVRVTVRVRARVQDPDFLLFRSGLLCVRVRREIVTCLHC